MSERQDPSAEKSAPSSPRGRALESIQLERDVAPGLRVRVSIEGTDEAALAEDAMEAAAAIVRDSVAAIESSAAPASRFGIVGASSGISTLFQKLERVARSSATVLVVGENGTGKELVARAIHAHSPRAHRPFIAVNCGGFNDNLLESELFGHKRGAFTGASIDKTGLIEAADGGTFFLDEVGEMSPALQVKLLRVLQEGTFLPVGGVEPKKVDVRVVAATHRDLQSMVQSGSFREDLYYRLHVVVLRVPPLRDRGQDIVLLAKSFLEGLCERHSRKKVLTPEAVEALQQHSWPGNVRELQNEIERAFVLSGDAPVIVQSVLSAAVLAQGRISRPSGVPPTTSSQNPESIAEGSLPKAVERLERKLLAEALERSGGNRTHAAELLGISRRNLIRKVQEYGL